MNKKQKIEYYEKLLKKNSLTCQQREAFKKYLFNLKLEYFDKRFKLPYNTKLDYSKRLISNVLKKYNSHSCVGCSFGKDSTVLVHLVIQNNPNVLVAFANTGVEYPETLEFRDLLVDKWNLNYVEVHPDKTFWQCVDEYGYPTIRYMGKEAKKKGTVSGTPRCCYHLKEKPMKQLYREKKIEAIFLGLSADESYNRKWTMIRYGELYKTKKNCPYEMIKCNPLAYWTEEEVWRYIKENNLLVSKTYEYTNRNGCMPCTGYIGWKKKLSKIKPKLYRKIIKDMMGSNLDDFIGVF